MIMKKLILLILVMFIQVTFSFDLKSQHERMNFQTGEPVISPNSFTEGSASDRIEASIRKAINLGINSIEIPRFDRITGKTVWLIDRAIVLPSDFTLILRDCFIRLSPGTRDNIITNSGARTQPLTENQNINILGTGNVILSSGLETHFDLPGDKSGYRTIGVLLYNTEHFTIENIIIEESQAWAISLENGCAFGRISNVEFRNSGKYPNQDGIDLRKGCHDIIIENITGTTGDDMIALTGLRNPDLDWKTEVREREEGKRKPSMQVGGSGWRENDDIYNISINNVKGTHVGRQCCSLIRLLNNDGVKIYNVFINDIMDTAPDGKGQTDQAINIGDDHPYWTRERNKLGETSRIFIDNVVSNAPSVIRIRGTLKDSRLTNISQYGTNNNPRRYENNGLIVYGKDVKVENVKIEAFQY
jgi:hypothetical protein